jgi:NADPH:quinone reductase-like Zn-dependent oxidoreductase
VLEGYGGVDRLTVREMRPPDPRPGQVLVRVAAAALNPLDCRIRRGRLRLLRPASFPLVPGFDIAGEVAAVGPEVGDLEPGDRVFALLDSPHGGGCAEYAVADRRCVAIKPPELTWEEAAAMPMAALTALQALRDVADLRAGQRTAVVGAAGGVGHFAVQLAAAEGARVTAVAGPAHQEFVRRLGAERAVDYTHEDFIALEPAGGAAGAAGRGGRAHRLARGDDRQGLSDAGLPAGARDDDGIYDTIFDAAGVLSFGECEPALIAGGIYVTTRRGPAIAIARLRAGLAAVIDPRTARRAGAVAVRASGADLTILAELAAAGLLRPAIERVYPLAAVGAAQAALDAGHVRGKLVVKIDA